MTDPTEPNPKALESQPPHSNGGADTAGTESRAAESGAMNRGGMGAGPASVPPRGLLASLLRNISAGFRLGLFLPVTRDDFRIGADHFAVLCAFNLLVWMAGSAVRTQFAGSFNTGALSVTLATVTIVLLISLLVANLLRQPSLLTALAVMLVSTDALFEIAGTLIYLAFEQGWLAAMPSARFGVYLAYLAWVALSAVRAVWILASWRARGFWPATLVLIAVVCAFAYVPRDEPWVVDTEGDERPAEILNEEAFHQQGAMLARELEKIALQRPGVDDLYFLGVAPYASQDTFALELSKVKALMDESFDTRERSIALVNNRATLAQAPIATATNLRTALTHFGEIMNPEEDVLFLFITTHGSSNHQLSFDWPPLQLQQVNPTSLSRMLADSGIKWKVIVISACYSGGFIEALRDPNTAIITAADATHTSFGCEASSDFTWFSRALFDEALRAEAQQGRFSFTEAFARAQVSVAAREKQGGLEASNPQLVVGEAMREKLKLLEQRLAARPRPVVPPPSPAAPRQPGIPSEPVPGVQARLSVD